MIKLLESFDYDTLLRHIKHIDEFKDDERFNNSISRLKDAINSFSFYYNAVADDLARSNAGVSTSLNDDIVGFVNKDDYCVKYNRKNGDFVIYNPRSTILKTKTLHKKTYQQYLNNLNRDFKEELPENN